MAVEVAHQPPARAIWQPAYYGGRAIRAERERGFQEREAGRRLQYAGMQEQARQFDEMMRFRYGTLAVETRASREALAAQAEGRQVAHEQAKELAELRGQIEEGLVDKRTRSELEVLNEQWERDYIKRMDELADRADEWDRQDDIRKEGFRRQDKQAVDEMGMELAKFEAGLGERGLQIAPHAQAAYNQKQQEIMTIQGRDDMTPSAKRRAISRLVADIVRLPKAPLMTMKEWIKANGEQLDDGTWLFRDAQGNPHRVQLARKDQDPNQLPLKDRLTLENNYREARSRFILGLVGKVKGESIDKVTLGTVKTYYSLKDATKMADEVFPSPSWGPGPPGAPEGLEDIGRVERRGDVTVVSPPELEAEGGVGAPGGWPYVERLAAKAGTSPENIMALFWAQQNGTPEERQRAGSLLRELLEGE